MTVLRFNKVGIKAISACVPQKKVSNYDLGHLFPSDYLDKLINSIGIEEKRIADEHVCASDLCFQAARKLMVDNHIEPESIFIISVSNTGLYCSGHFSDIAAQIGIAGYNSVSGSFFSLFRFHLCFIYGFCLCFCGWGKSGVVIGGRYIL